MELPGWNQPDFNDEKWHQMKTEEYGYDNLIASMGPKILEKERFTPQIIQTPNGETVLDFGQNIGGYVEMKIEDVPIGTEIRLTHGEVLDKYGNFTQENISLFTGSVFLMKRIKEFYQLDTYIHGGGSVIYKPRFSMKGFRYVRIEGYSGEFYCNCCLFRYEDYGKF
jgi:alpha-L-rhamnosidase